jgi:hypothetical protein
MATGTEGTNTPPTRSLLEDSATISHEPRPQSIMKGTYTNGKIESLETRSVQWQEKGDLDIQTRLDQLGELKWIVRNLQIQGNFDQRRTLGPMAHVRMDMEQQSSEYKMTKETKSQDRTECV